MVFQRITNIILFFVFCFDGKVSSHSISTNLTDKEELLPALLSLHETYCGHGSLCRDNVHVEPEVDMFPLPCCVPCSCLPTCRALGNCCPNLTYTSLKEHKNAYVTRESVRVTESSSLQTSSKETVISGLSSTEAPQNQADGVFYDRSTNPTHENSTFKTYGRRSDIFHLETVSELFSVEPGLNASDATNLSTDGLNTNDDGAEKNARAMQSTVCFRPQIMYRPNIYLDSQAYEMVGSCLNKFDGTETDLLCKNGIKNDHLDDIVPVTSTKTGITYLNKHCLLCNENILDSERIYVWKPIIKIKSWIFQRLFYESPQDIVNRLIKYKAISGRRGGNIIFVPPKTEIARSCQNFDIHFCNQTGLWDNNDETVDSLCQFGYSLPIIWNVNPDSVLVYKNIACVFCNIEPNMLETLLQDNKKCFYYPISARSPIFSMEMNIPIFKRLEQQEVKNDDVSSDSYISDAILRLTGNYFCLNGYISIWNTCRRVFCPRDHYVDGNRCIPLYDVLMGLNLHFKLGIIPHQPIHSVDRQDFAESVKYLAIMHLNQTTSLQLKEVSLWYLPNSDSNPNEFYLLNMIFSTPNEGIKLSKSINDIQYFHQTLRSKASLRHSNGNLVKLKYYVGNKVHFDGKSVTDLMSGIPLVPLGNGWHPTQPGPHMTISEAAWCYRTKLAKTEMKRVTRNVIKIINANTILFADQYDRDLDVFLVCIDELSDYIDKTASRPRFPFQITTRTAEKNTNKIDTFPNSQRAWVISIVVFVAVVFSVVFNKIKAKFTIIESNEVHTEI